MKLKIKEKYRLLGFTQESFAKAVGVSRTTVSNWINGKKFPQPPRLKKICEILKCEPKDLI
jgi:transcriptional regulator with XRE-family HTH domain